MRSIGKPKQAAVGLVVMLLMGMSTGGGVAGAAGQHSDETSRGGLEARVCQPGGMRGYSAVQGEMPGMRPHGPGMGPGLGPGHKGHGRLHLRQRHHTFMSGNVPQEYLGPENPVGFTVEAIVSGAKIYADQCAQCHGDKGEGDGPVAQYLDPPPASLAFTVNRHIGTDGFLLWSIERGGEQFESQMPAFEDILSRSQIWEVIAYMRAGFPASNPKAKGRKRPAQ